MKKNKKKREELKTKDWRIAGALRLVGVNMTPYTNIPLYIPKSVHTRYPYIRILDIIHNNILQKNTPPRMSASPPKLEVNSQKQIFSEKCLGVITSSYRTQTQCIL